MTIACIQTEPDFGNVETNLRDAVPLIEEADADLCVLPELFATGYAFESRSEAYDLSEYIPGGPTTSRLTERARASGSTIVAGVAERSGDQLFNSAVVITPSGWLGTYRKAHLFYEETGIFTPGDAFQVWTVTDRQRRSYRLGVMVCFEESSTSSGKAASAPQVPRHFRGRQKTRRRSFVSKSTSAQRATSS